MTPRQNRMWMVIGIVAGVSAAAWLGFRAFQENVNLFVTPTVLADGKAPQASRFRLGGMVEKGSVIRVPGSIEINFLVTDYKHTVPVKYSGVLPDLFRDGQGVVANGRLENGVFVADEILAKHDEKYMPPEVAKALKDNPPPPSTIPST